VVATEYRLFAEIAAMLRDSLCDAGASSTVALVPSPIAAPLDADADAVVIVGGTEVRHIEVRGPGTRRPFTAYWALDPFPPPDLSDEAMERGLAYASAHVRARGSAGGTRARVRALLPRSLKRVAGNLLSRVVARRGSLVGDATAADIEVERLSFLCLHEVRAAVTEARLDLVMVTNSNTVRSLARQGVEALRLPVGAHPSMGRDEGLVRDRDVAYLGLPAGDRGERFAAVQRSLVARGLEPAILAGCWGADRARELNRTKVVVHFGRDSWHPALIRFVLASACGAMVLAEAPMAATEPFVEGTHFVARPAGELADAAEHYASSETDRAAIVANARRLIETEVTMAHVAERLLTAIGRASPG
jgi:hypothetical protein